MPACCSALYCTSSTSYIIEGISFHKFPKDPEQLESWLKALDRGSWRPANSSRLCSLHFTDDAFDVLEAGRRTRLKPEAVPTIFLLSPAQKSVLKKIQQPKKSEEKVGDPTTLHSAPFLEPLVLLQEGADLDGEPPTKQARRDPPQMPIVLDVTPIAVEKSTKVKIHRLPVLTDGAGEAQVKKESENQPRECSITPQGQSCDPCSGVESISIRDVRSLNTFEERLRRKAMEEARLYELKVNGSLPSDQPDDPDDPPEKEAPRMIPDGATNSILMVNLVCPHCQKACKVCLNIKPPNAVNTNAWTNLQTNDYQPSNHLPPKTNLQTNEELPSYQLLPETNLQTNDELPSKPKMETNDSSAAQVEKLREKVVSLELSKLLMLKKIKALTQSVRRLKAKNQLFKDQNKDMVVVGTVNGIVKNQGWKKPRKRKGKSEIAHL